MLSLASAYAVSVKATRVAYAAHGRDHPIYLDCRPEFATSMEAALQAGHYADEAIKIWTPFINVTKTDIARWGTMLKAPLDSTWSCYNDGELHCGRCGTCVERKEAFEQSGVEDPTQDERKVLGRVT